jgi:hypothetical protein
LDAPSGLLYPNFTSNQSLRSVLVAGASSAAVAMGFIGWNEAYGLAVNTFFSLEVERVTWPE